jgi:predicted site-specific integrase-resolvase
MTISEAAKKWSCTKVRVYQWLKDGRIHGAVADNGHWSIPNESNRPEKLKPGRKANDSVANA